MVRSLAEIIEAKRREGEAKRKCHGQGTLKTFTDTSGRRLTLGSLTNDSVGSVLDSSKNSSK